MILAHHQLLEEDFSLAQFALRAAFLGVVGEPKRSAIALCEWASRQDEPEKALLSWARKNRRGAFGISEEPVEDGWS